MRKKLRLLVLFLGLQCAAFAQTKNTTGIVIDARTAAVLPGVSITIPGTAIGTVTDEKGVFRLNIPKNAKQIHVSFSGYEEQTVPLTGKSLRISLSITNKSLDEVVVVGYGTEKKKDLTGAITTVSAEDIGERRVVQVSDALEGQIAGVTVTRDGGAPGTSSTILFRGITTIGDNAPLIIVDGVPSPNIDNLNPDDIESITALKDAASTSIYGTRAAAGVLLITTKRAKSGQASVDYNYEYGNIRPTSLPTYVDAVRYMQLFNEYLANDGSAPVYSQQTINTYMQNNATNPDLYPNTDWQAVVLKKSAPRDLHELSFTVGTDKLKTRASLGYSNTQGLYDNLSYKKYNALVNNDFKFNNQLSGSFDMSVVGSVSDGVNQGSGIVYDSRVLPPIYAAEYTNGQLAPGKDGRNPLAQAEQGGFNNTNYTTLTGRAVLNYKLIDGLTISGILSPTYMYGRNADFSKQISFTTPTDPSDVIAVNQPNTTLSEDRPYTYSFNGQFLANYTKTFNQVHNFSALAGYEDNYSYTEDVSASRGSFTLTEYPYLDDGLLTLRDNGGSASEDALRSYFSRVTYNYKNKYYLQANGRYDGSSRFAAADRWGFFPSFSGGWTISQENFFKNIKPVNFLKLRGSWGQAGNDQIGTYPYQADITFNNALFYNGGTVTAETSGGQLAYAVNNITWETQQTTDLGLDATFFHNKLSVSGDVYQKETKNILLELNVPVYIGLTAPYQNAGKVSAKGWEITTNWNDHIAGWRYSFGFNIADAKTHIDDLKGTSILGDQALIQGGEYDEWYGYKSAGLFQTAAEVSSSPVLSSATKAGDIKYVDINGDGKITPDKDKVLLGGSLPRYTFAFNGRLAYKRFDFSFVAQGVGHQLVRLGTNTVEPFLEAFGNVPTIIDHKFWSANNTEQQNLEAKYPRLSRASDPDNYALSDFWLINGRYLRIKNLTLGYDIKSGMLNKLNMRGLRVYVACNDAFTFFSKFPKGSDPEVDASSYPIVKTFMAGLNVKF